MAQSFYKEQCYRQQRLSKSTLLSMLAGEAQVNDFAAQQQYNRDLMTRGKAYADSRWRRFQGLKSRAATTGTWLHNLDPNQWSITSFDPDSRLVCIEVDAGVAIQHCQITLPYLAIAKG